jgi:hypothetical protein
MNRPRALSPAEEMRILAGCAMQPFLAGAVAFLSFPVLLVHGQTLAGGTPGDVFDAALSVAIGAGFVAVFVTLLGVPIAIWLAKRRQVRLHEALIAGLLLGNVPFMLGTALAGSYGVEGFIRGAAFSSVLGVACAGAFWAIAFRVGRLRSAAKTN